jgi:hypothetical protein
VLSCAKFTSAKFTSAKTGEGVEALFLTLGQAIWRRAG